MIAYTGIETVSNLAEEARDPARTIPRSIGLAGDRGLRDLLHAAARRALGDARGDDRRRADDAARPCHRRRAAMQNDPILGVVDNLGITGVALDALQIYVGILAATILFIATNAGIIGASRITYSMATYRQLPERVPASSTRSSRRRGSRSSCSPASSRSSCSCPGQVGFLGTMYSFGAMLSFTVAHAAVVQLRLEGPRTRSSSSARGRTSASGGVDWPLFALLGGIGHGFSRGSSSSSRTRRRGRWASPGWRSGWSTTSSTGGRSLHVPLTETVKAPPAARPGHRARVPDDRRSHRRRASRRARRCTWRRDLPPSGVRRSSRCA